MLGWEFAPIKSGGLGVACRGIADGLQRDGVKVVFALPSYLNSEEDTQEGNLKIVSKRFKNLKIKVDQKYIFSPYQGLVEVSGQQLEWKNLPAGKKAKQIYGQEFWLELAKFAEEAKELAKENPHDLIHVHDWMTYKAGEKVKDVSEKPLIAHVHATEMDRTGGHPNQYIYNIEREGFYKSDHIIVVSGLTKKILIKYYDIPENKISVVHNAHVVQEHEHKTLPEKQIKQGDKVVLFLGRVTIQKGPDYFIEMARRVLQKRKDVKFVIAGNGDMLPHIISKIIDYDMQENVFCAGFLGGADLDRAFYESDLYVMPSVSEPFGLTALEATEFKTPVLMSKTAGVGEVIKNCLRADFWDIEKMANQVMAVLDLPVLGKTLVDHASQEIRYLTWHQQAQKIRQIYHTVTGKHV